MLHNVHGALHALEPSRTLAIGLVGAAAAALHAKSTAIAASASDQQRREAHAMAAASLHAAARVLHEANGRPHLALGSSASRELWCAAAAVPRAIVHQQLQAWSGPMFRDELLAQGFLELPEGVHVDDTPLHMPTAEQVQEDVAIAQQRVPESWGRLAHGAKLRIPCGGMRRCTILV